MNTEFTVKLTPKNDKPVYSQSLPMPIHVKEDVLVELALMHKYGIITVLPFSKYASPIFAQRKPNGKLRLLVDLRKINSLISDDYINNNHPESTLSDAAQHLAGKSLFCKLDFSQAYHCLQMADQRSVEMLAFNFASRTFAYKRIGPRFKPFPICFLKFLEGILGPCSQSRPMCPICGRHRNCSQYCSGTDPEHQSCILVYSQSRIETINGKVPFWCETSEFSGKNNFARRCSTSNSQIQKLFE